MRAGDQPIDAGMPAVLGAGRRRQDHQPLGPAADGHVGVASRDIDAAGTRGVGRVTSTTAGRRGRPGGAASDPVKAAGMCWATRIGQGKSRECRQHRVQRRRPTSRRPDEHQPRARRPRAGVRGRGLGGAARRGTMGAERARARRRSARRCERRTATRWRPRSPSRPGSARTRRSPATPRRRAWPRNRPRPTPAPPAWSAPSAVRDETITTGQGRSTMIRSRQPARPCAASGRPA
jgi:hypothetical protein